MARKHCQTREFRDSSQADDHTVFDQDRDHSAMTISDHCVDVNKREIARQYIYCQTRELNNNHNGAEMRETQELTILHKQLCATLTKSSSSKQSTTHELSRNCKNSVPVEMNTDCEISELDSDDYPRNGIEVNVKTIESRKALPTSKVVVQIKNGSSAVDEENLNVSVLNVGTLWKQFIHEQKEHMNAKWREEQLQTALLHQQMEFKHLLIEYNSLLQKYAKAENIIDSLKLLRELKNTNESKTAINEQNCARTPMLQSSITFSDDGDLSNFSLTSDDSRLFQAQKDKSEVQQTGHDDYILPEKEHSNNDLPVKSIKTKNDLNVDTACMHANWLLEELQLSFMAVQDDNITNAMKEEQITWLKHRFHSLINDFEKLKEVSDVRSLEETIHKIQRCFKKLEDLRINYFNQESRNTSGVSKSERLNSSDRSRLQDKVNLPKIFEFEEGINIQREDKSTAENLKPNEDVRLLQDETQEPNWALFSCFKTVDKKHHSSTHSKTSNVNIRRKDILRTPSDKACYNDHKCSLQIRADTTVLQRNESSLVGQATNEMEVEKYNSISETRLNPCNYHLPSNTRNSNILPANNNQKYVQQVQTRGDQKQMAKTNSQKKASAETGPHKNEVSKLRLLTSLDSADQKAYYLHKKSIKILCDVFDMPQSDSLSKSTLYY